MTMHVLLASFELQNNMIKDALKEKLDPKLYEKLDIKEFPIKLGSSLEIVDELIKKIRDTEILVVFDAPITYKVIQEAKNLKFIFCMRGGPVNIDIAAAEKRGILVSHARGQNAEAVADHTIGLLLAVVKNIVKGDYAIRKGLWERKELWKSEETVFRSVELKRRTIGIVGFGVVGRLVADRAKGFGMRILVYDPYVAESEIKSRGGEKVDFETLLKESDFITVHIRLSEETYHMFGEKQFSLMKPSAYFINTSRGPAVDQKALYKVLKEKRIAGAGLDVFEEEPIGANHPFCTLDNIVLTPHIAYVGTDYYRGAMMAAEEINRYLTGEPLKYIAKSEYFMFERKIYHKIFKGRRIY